MWSIHAGSHKAERATNDFAAGTTRDVSFPQSASRCAGCRVYRAILSMAKAAKPVESFAETFLDYRVFMRQAARFLVLRRSQIDRLSRLLRVSLRDANRMFRNHNKNLDFASTQVCSHLVSQTEEESEHSVEVSHFKYLDRGRRPIGGPPRRSPVGSLGESQNQHA